MKNLTTISRSVNAQTGHEVTSVVPAVDPKRLVKFWHRGHKYEAPADQVEAICKRIDEAIVGAPASAQTEPELSEEESDLISEGIMAAMGMERPDKLEAAKKAAAGKKGKKDE